MLGKQPQYGTLLFWQSVHNASSVININVNDIILHNHIYFNYFIQTTNCGNGSISKRYCLIRGREA